MKWGTYREKQYDLFIGLDVSKGKADDAIYKRNRDRNVFDILELNMVISLFISYTSVV